MTPPSGERIEKAKNACRQLAKNLRRHPDFLRAGPPQVETGLCGTTVMVRVSFQNQAGGLFQERGHRALTDHGYRYLTAAAENAAREAGLRTHRRAYTHAGTPDDRTAPTPAETDGQTAEAGYVFVHGREAENHE